MMRRRMVMVLGLLGSIMAGGCGKPDDCQRFIDRSRPILIEIGEAAGKPLPDSLFDELVADCRKAESREPTMDCVLVASSEAAVRDCWKQGFGTYGGDRE